TTWWWRAGSRASSPAATPTCWTRSPRTSSSPWSARPSSASSGSRGPWRGSSTCSTPASRSGIESRRSGIMTVYKAPLRDYRFVLHELFDVSKLTELPGYAEATPELVDTVLEEGAKVCEEVLFPLNRNGDEEGCTFENGVVRTPKGFKQAYDTFRDGGWTALGCDPAYGRHGLPPPPPFFPGGRVFAPPPPLP